jgi:hypothetical protein
VVAAVAVAGAAETVPGAVGSGVELAAAADLVTEEKSSSDTATALEDAALTLPGCDNEMFMGTYTVYEHNLKWVEYLPGALSHSPVRILFINSLYIYVYNIHNKFHIRQVWRSGRVEDCGCEDCTFKPRQCCF